MIEIKADLKGPVLFKLASRLNQIHFYKRGVTGGLHGCGYSELEGIVMELDAENSYSREATDEEDDIVCTL